MSLEKQTRITSPCVDNCCLNNDDICLGCFRHLDEITSWSSSSNDEKQQILASCKNRKQQSKDKYS